MTIRASDLSDNARVRTHTGPILIDKSAGATDIPLWVVPCAAKILRVSFPVTETFDTAGASLLAGTKSSSGHFATLAISSTASVGTSVATTEITNGNVTEGTVVVADMTLASGAGAGFVQIDWEPREV